MRQSRPVFLLVSNLVVAALSGCVSAEAIQESRDRVAEAKARTETAFVPYAASFKRYGEHSGTMTHERSTEAVRRAEAGNTDAVQRDAGIVDAQALALDFKRHEIAYKGALADWRAAAEELRDKDNEAGNQALEEVKQFDQAATQKLATGQ